MQLKPVFPITAAALSLCLAAPLATPAAAEAPSPVKTAELSARLYALGLEGGDPLLILSAAKLRKSLAPASTDRRPDDGAGGQGAPVTWEDMLDSAAALAGEDEVVAGLIDDIRAETTKGVATGPVYNIASLGNGKSHSYAGVDYRGGEYAEVYVEAKSITDMNLTVTDAQGRLVCSDTDSSHIAYCGWRPAEAGAFTIRVENRGPAGADYALMTN